MKLQLKKAETSVILIVKIQDSSATDGSGLGSLDQTSSITGGYVKRNGTGVALAVDENVTTEGTYQAPSAAGKVRIGTPANMPTGYYELHFHNDLFTTADYVVIGLSGAADMAPLDIEIQLTDLDSTLSAILAAVAQGIKRGVALPYFKFPMVDKTTKILKTGVAGSITAQKSIDDADFIACDGSVSEIGTSGVYKIDLSAADLDGNVIMLLFTQADCDPRLMELKTEPVESPSESPSVSPSESPSVSPSESLSESPSESPSASPS